MDVYQQLAYNSARWTFGPLLSLLIRLKCQGQENIPHEEGALVVANHRNPFLDPFAMAIKIARPVNFMAASVFFTLPVVGRIYHTWGVVPLEVSGGKNSHESLEKAASLLKEGELVCMYPEGVHTIANTRKAHKIGTFKTGFARIALLARALIIPVALIGRGERTLARFPPWMVNPFFDHPDYSQGAEIGYYKRLLIRIGRPLDLSGFYDEEITSHLVRQISEKVRRIIINLYNGDELDRFMTGDGPIDVASSQI